MCVIIHVHTHTHFFGAWVLYLVHSLLLHIDISGTCVLIYFCHMHLDTACRYGPVRVVNTHYAHENGLSVHGGTVEVCYNDTYYALCDGEWTDDDATVICNIWGYNYPYYRMLY